MRAAGVGAEVAVSATTMRTPTPGRGALVKEWPAGSTGRYAGEWLDDDPARWRVLGVDDHATEGACPASALADGLTQQRPMLRVGQERRCHFGGQVL